jgi:hypothetical protein
MSKKDPIRKIEVEALKTPEGQVPTVEGLQAVAEGLFEEVLETRKDIARLIPNLEKELQELRKAIADQTVLTEITTKHLQELKKEITEEVRKTAKIQREMKQPDQLEAALTSDSQKNITRLVRKEVKKQTKLVLDSLIQMEKDIASSKKELAKRMDEQIQTLTEQLDDLSSKTELQLLEILESLNQKPLSSNNTKQSKGKNTKTTKKIKSKKKQANKN